MTYKHPKWRIKALLDCILAALGILIIFLFVSFNPPFYTILIILCCTSPLWLFLIFDIFFGPTSKGQIRTITSTEDIVLAKRYGKSKKVLQKLKDLIEECQGAVDNESLYGKTLEYSSPLLSPTKIIPDREQIPTTKYNNLYSLFLALLFLEIIVSSIQFMFPGDISTLLGSFSVIVIIVNIIVLFKQKRLYIRKPLQILSWISFIVFLSFILVYFILGFFLIFEYGTMPETRYISITQTDPRFLTMNIIYLGLVTSLVFFGTVFSMKGHHSVYSTQ